MASAKDLKPLIKAAEKQGWTITKTRGNHFKWTSPNGGTPYFSPSTPSDSRAIKNLTAALRKNGLTI